jgi:hypothetical protein
MKSHPRSHLYQPYLTFCKDVREKAPTHHHVDHGAYEGRLHPPRSHLAYRWDRPSDLRSCVRRSCAWLVCRRKQTNCCCVGVESILTTLVFRVQWPSSLGRCGFHVLEPNSCCCMMRGHTCYAMREVSCGFFCWTCKKSQERIL